MSIVRLPAAIDGDSALRLLDDIEAACAPHTPIVFTGGNGIFCDGLDFTPLLSGAAVPDAVAAAVEAFSRCLARIRSASSPTIALVDGAARGGGVGLAAACDVVIATDRSRFALPELLWGLLPAIIYASLRERMSVQQCRVWMLTGGARTAADARACGLVDEVVPPEDLERAGRRWQKQLSRPRPDAVARLRRFVSEDVTAATDAYTRGVALTTESLLDERLRASLRRFHETGELPWDAF